MISPKIFIISILGVLIYLGTIIYVNKNKTNKSNNINNKTTQIISEENKAFNLEFKYIEFKFSSSNLFLPPVILQTLKKCSKNK